MSRDLTAAYVSFSPQKNYPSSSILPQPLYTVSTISTAGAVTYTAAQFLGGLILRDPNGAGRSDVTPTAALLIAAMEGVQNGSGFEFELINTADANETITMTAGTGVTIVGTATIAQSNNKRFLLYVNEAGAAGATQAVTLYSLGTTTT